MHKLARLDHAYVWHPFTQMRDWLRQEPTVIVEGKGAVLRDVRGREYLDANASIWTNLHGHQHPAINAAIKQQLGRIAHSSALGLANEPASRLAAELVRLANVPLAHVSGKSIPLRRPHSAMSSRATRPNPLQKVFFSDDGSTAVEVALKLAYEYARRTGRSRRPKFLSLEGAYHGDTIGAVSLGHIDLFHKAYAGLLFKSAKIPAPYCYRCRFNRAKPERADARDYRRCQWECLGLLEKKINEQRRKGEPFAALVVEPLIQGAAGMIAQPPGWLRQATDLIRGDGAQLIADEVMTGFGRTGPWFACQAENVQPDFLAVAKGLTGGYLPMAATLTTKAVFEAFLGEYGEFRTFFHGHSYTGNQLGAAAGLASLELLQSRSSIRARAELERALESSLDQLWRLPRVGDIRRVGLIVGVELVRDWRSRQGYALRERAGIRVCEAMARRGVLTRPIGNVIVLMPPYCTTAAQVEQIIGALKQSILEVLA
jgi:adenosylmethionine-8-amino-7-oxononanoate aminotransferase